MLAALALLATAALAAQEAPRTERWRCTLDAGGAELPFELEVAGDVATVVNGAERIAVPVFERGDVAWRLEFPHYGSSIEAAHVSEGRVEGVWRVPRAGGAAAEVPFVAERGLPYRFTPKNGIAPAPASVAGRWRIAFEGDDSPAALVLEAGRGTGLTGTVLTRTGDHRYLAGELASGPSLRLSCFDGAHAFLYEATLGEDGAFAGVFRSGNWHGRRFTAVRDESVELPDPFAEVRWQDGASIADLAFPDLAGEETRVADLLGRVTLVQLLGSWCPNCHDETRYLTELLGRYRARGLAVVGLAFELSGDPERDRAQVARFAEARGVPYPLLVAGSASKRDAAAALGVLDRVLAFPTTLFVDANGRVRAVHSGFAGPATGAAHSRLRAEFEGRVESLLVEPPGRSQETWGALSTLAWTERPEAAQRVWTFHAGERGAREVWIERGRGAGAPEEREVLPVRVLGELVWVGDRLFCYDTRALVLRDSRDWGARLAPQAVPATPLVDPGEASDAALAALLASDDPLLRQEAAWALGHRRAVGAGAATAAGAPKPAPPLAPLLADPDLGVRLAATWAVGRSRETAAVPALAEQLASPHPGLRREAARALRHLERSIALEPELRARLDALAEQDPVRTVRVAARAD